MGSKKTEKPAESPMNLQGKQTRQKSQSKSKSKSIPKKAASPKKTLKREETKLTKPQDEDDDSFFTDLSMRSKGLISGEASSNLLKKLKSQDKASKLSISAEFVGQEHPVIVNVRDQIISEQHQSRREKVAEMKRTSQDPGGNEDESDNELPPN